MQKNNDSQPKEYVSFSSRMGHKISYTSVKDEVLRWKRNNALREVFILQEPSIDLILCGEKNREHIELLQLDRGDLGG